MFADTLSVTYNAVAKTLTRMTNGSYQVKYGLDDGGTMYYNLRIEHTVPSAANGVGETHMIRLDIDNYDADGAYLRRDSAWFVLKTSDAKQDSTAIDYTAQALVDFLSDANLLKLVAREA